MPKLKEVKSFSVFKLYFIPSNEYYLLLLLASVLLFPTRNQWEKAEKMGPTHQIVHAQQEGFDAAVALTIPAGSDAQVDPHQLGEELQGEAAQPVLRAPVQLEQLVAHGFQQLERKAQGRGKQDEKANKPQTLWSLKQPAGRTSARSDSACWRGEVYEGDVNKARSGVVPSGVARAKCLSSASVGVEPPESKMMPASLNDTMCSRVNNYHASVIVESIHKSQAKKQQHIWINNRTFSSKSLF